jgi:HD-like signal output (HDOD) protein
MTAIMPSVRWVQGGPPSSVRTQPRPPVVWPDASPAASELELDLLFRLRARCPAAPITKAAATAARRLAEDPDASTDAIVQLVEGDPGLAARLVSAASSSMLRCAEPVHSIRAAIARLGSESTRDVLFQAGSLPGVDESMRFHADIERCHRRSVRSAVMARALVERTGASIESAFLIGLLHDIGETCVYRALAQLSGPMPAPGESRRLVSRYHEAAGASLAAAWQLPQVLVTVCGAHHGDELTKVPEQRLAAACDALIDATVRGLSRAALETLAAVGVGSHDARALATRHAPGRSRED